MDTKLFTIRECGKGATVCGLDCIPIDNGNLRRLAPERSLDLLDVGEVTVGRAGRDAYEIVRVA